MNSVSDNKISLTREEAEFIKDLFLRKRELITHVIRSHLGNEFQQLYEDCLSETYLTACEKIGILKVHEKPEAWLTVTAKLTTMQMLKKHKKDLFNEPIQEHFELHNEIDVFEDAVFNIWTENKVPQKLISRLTKREQEIYYLIFREQKTPTEIAKQLNISVNTVRNIKKNIIDKITYDIKNKNF